MKQKMKFGRKAMLFMLSLAFMLGMIPGKSLMVFAADAVPYQAWDESSGTVKAATPCMDYETISDQNAWGTAGQETWYVLKEDKTYSSRITVKGTVNLILCDGATLTAGGGIAVTAGNTLNIYGQSGGTGALVATGGNENAGIGGNGANGTVNIHGGTVTATGGKYAAGIGGGRKGNCGIICIYGGSINATGASGIGTGCDCSSDAGSKVIIYGGEITATGRTEPRTSYFVELGAAGIGHGGCDKYDIVKYPGPEVEVYGGKVIAYGPEVGIGGKVAAKEEVIYDTWGESARLFVAGGAVYGSDSPNPEEDPENIMRSPYSGRRFKYITILDHKHELTTNVEGATITSTCGNSDGLHPGELSGTLTINAPENLAWDGNEKPATVSGNDGIFFCEPKIVYSKKDDSTFSGVPIEEGTYTASVTINGVTASLDYTIGLPDVEAVSYRDGTTDKSTSKYLNVKADDTEWGNPYAERWFVVSSNVSLSNRVEITGTVNLILSDGKTLAANKGIEVSDGATLNVYAQSEGTGALVATGDSIAGIGGEGNINIYGGIITASGSEGISTGLTLADGMYLYGGGNSGATGPIILKDSNYIRTPFMVVNRTAHEAVSYQGESGSAETPIDYTVLSANWPGNTWSEGWYVVRGNVTLSGRVTLNGTVNLILSDGATLNAGKGITTTNATLNIFAQSKDTGILNATGESGAAAIGGGNGAAGGDVNIWGGTVYAVCEKGAVGIGAGSGNTSHGSLKVADAMSVACGFEAHPEKQPNSIVSEVNNDYAREQYMTVRNLSHTHKWSYSVEGATITATCSDTDNNHVGEKSVTLSIIAPSDLVKDGTEKPAILSEGYDTVAFPDDYTITYTKDGEAFSGIPTEVGKYVASITVEGKTANVSYSIVNLSDIPELSSTDTLWGTAGQETWYKVSQNVTINGEVRVAGDVNLILEDGKELTVNGRTRVGINFDGVKEPGTLSVYARSEDESTMGKLTFKGKDGDSPAQVTTSDSYQGQNGGKADSEALFISGDTYGDDIQYGRMAIHGGIVNIIGGNGGNGQSIKATSFKTYTTGYGGSGGNGLRIYSSRSFFIDGHAIVTVRGGNGGNGGDGDSGSQSGSLSGSAYNVNRGGWAGCGINGAGNGVVLGSTTARLTVIGGVQGRQGKGYGDHPEIWKEVNSDTLTAYDGIAFGYQGNGASVPVRQPVTTADETEYMPMFAAGADKESAEIVGEYTDEMYAEVSMTRKWYTVTFDMNGHGTNEPILQRVGAGKFATQPSDPIDAEFEFCYWQDENGKEFQFDTTHVTSDYTLKAVWVQTGLGGVTVEEADPTTGKAEVSKPDGEPSVGEEDKPKLESMMNSFDFKVPETDEERQLLNRVIQKALEDVDKVTKDNQNKAALKALVTAGQVTTNSDGTIPEGTKIVIKREVYITVIPVSFGNGSGIKSVQFNTIPNYRVLASAGDNDPIIVSSGNNVNDIDLPVDFTMNLPDDFATADCNYLSIKNNKGNYPGELGKIEDGQRKMTWRSIGLGSNAGGNIIRARSTAYVPIVQAIIPNDVDGTIVNLAYEHFSSGDYDNRLAVNNVKNGDTILLLQRGTHWIKSVSGKHYTIKLYDGVSADEVELMVDEVKVEFVNGEVSIKQKNPAVIKENPVAKILLSNGQAQELVSAGTVEGGTMNYAIGTDNTTAPTTGWSTSIPIGTEVGTYYVWYKVPGGDDYYDTTPLCVSASIVALSTLQTEAKGELDTLLGSKSENDYDEDEWTALTQAITDGKTAIDNATTIDEVTEAKNAAADAVSKAKTKAMKAAEKEAADTAAANAVMETISALPASNSVTAEDSDAVISARKAYDGLTSDQKEKVKEDMLQKLKDAEHKIAILQIMSAMSKVTDSSLLYTRKTIQLIDVSKIVLPEGCTLYYAIGDNATTAPEFDGTSQEKDKKWTASIPEKTDTGTYNVWFKVVGDEKYGDITANCVKVTIAKKAITITADSASKVYDGKALTKDAYTYSENDLLEGDTIVSVTITGTQTKVGSSDNVISKVVIKNSAGEDVTDCYDITFKKGTLTVTDAATTTETHTAADGTTTEKTVVKNTDGSVTEKEKVTAPNGTVSEKTTTTEKDGTVKTQETVVNTDGSKKESTSELKPNGDYEKKTVTTDKDGKTKEVVQTKSTDGKGVVTETKDTVKNDGTSTEQKKVTQPDGDYTAKTVSKDVKGKVTKTVTETKSTNDKTGAETLQTKTVKESGAAQKSNVVVNAKGNITKATVTETAADGKKATVNFKAEKNGDVAVNKIDGTKSTVTIPDTIVDANGKVHKVTKISAKILKGKKKVKKLVVGANVKTFEKNALAGSSVKTLKLNSVPKFKKGSLKTGGKLTIIVHSAKDKKQVKKQLKTAGAPKAKIKVKKS